MTPKRMKKVPAKAGIKDGVTVAVDGMVETVERSEIADLVEFVRKKAKKSGIQSFKARVDGKNFGAQSKIDISRMKKIEIITNDVAA